MLINLFGTGTIIMTSNFGFQDLNGEGVVNDLDISVAGGFFGSGGPRSFRFAARIDF